MADDEQIRVCEPALEPQMTKIMQIADQMGRHKSILDIQTGLLRRISLRIFLEGSNTLELNIFLTLLGFRIGPLNNNSDFL